MFLPKPRLLTLALIPALALGCGDDATAVDSDETGTYEEDTGDEETTADGDSADEGTETGEPEPLDPGWPALGIQMAQIEANQGTAIFIGEDGEWVEGGDRLGALIRDRNTLIRVHYTVDPGWVAREIEARFILEYGDGTREVLSQVRMVDGDSQPNSLGGTFIFGLDAGLGQVQPDSEFLVQFHEVDEGAMATAAGLAEGINQTPADFELVGIQPEPMELKMVFVPYHHLYEDIDRSIDTSDAAMEFITTTLFQWNAAQELIYEIHEELVWDQPMDNLGAVLGPIAALRDNELAFPNVYYHALFPVPGGGVNGVAGIASVPGPGKGEAMQRVSATAIGNNPAFAADVVAHEVGHNEGMQHVFCPFAEAASPDPTYPYQNGVIGQWGFGILDFSLRAPDNYRDYMSYCNPAWVSTWSWMKSFSRIRTLTSWDYESGASSDPSVYFAQDRPMLVGTITEQGQEFWFVTHGTLPSSADPYGDEYDHHIELRTDGELAAALPTVVRYTNDYSTAWLIAELPDAYERLEGVDEIVRIDELDQAITVPVSAVQLSQRSTVQAP